MRKRLDPQCLCGTARDDAQYTFFECEKWQSERNALARHTADTIVAHMLDSEENWGRVATSVEAILRRKKREEEGATRP